MHRAHKLALAAALALGACAMAHAAGPGAEGPRAEVIHWWTSGGESAAVKTIADAYRAAGGVWVDTAVAGNEQARAVAVNRIVGGNPPAAAQFNASMQLLDLVEQGMLNPVDKIAAKERWDTTLPAPIRDVIKVKGHYDAVALNVHMPTWIWYSKAAFKQAGIAREPASMDQLFAALDACAHAALAVMKDRTRHVGNGEVYLTPDQNGALVDVLSAYRNSAMPVEKAQKNIAAALKG